MTFNATSVTLDFALRNLRETAVQEKNYLNTANTALAGNIDALYALAILANVNRVVPLMDSYANLTGMAAYAQTQLGSATYDIVAEYTNMRSALVAVGNWLTTNIPSNAVTVTNGVQVGATYTPSVTAPLKSLVAAAAATIS